MPSRCVLPDSVFLNHNSDKNSSELQLIGGVRCFRDWWDMKFDPVSPASLIHHSWVWRLIRRPSATQLFITLADRILQVWKVITAAIILSLWRDRNFDGWMDGVALYFGWTSHLVRMTLWLFGAFCPLFHCWTSVIQTEERGFSFTWQSQCGLNLKCHSLKNDYKQTGFD